MFSKHCRTSGLDGNANTSCMCAHFILTTVGIVLLKALSFLENRLPCKVAEASGCHALSLVYDNTEGNKRQNWAA